MTSPAVPRSDTGDARAAGGVEVADEGAAERGHADVDQSPDRPTPPRVGPVASTVLALTATVALTVALWASVGLGSIAVAVGVACGTALAVVLARALGGGLVGTGSGGLGPADLVTLARAVMTCGVAALTAQLLAGAPVTTAILALAAPALALDAVDGLVARRTGTSTRFGARFDGEVDALLILVLSVAVGWIVGWWVMAAGLARYLFALAGLALPWMRGPLPYRYWRKVVTAVVGIALVAALAEAVPEGVRVGLLVVAVALLAESFGRDVAWLWRRRHETPVAPLSGRARAIGIVLATFAAVALVWFALLSPQRPDHVLPLSFLRIPGEALVLTGLVLAVSLRSARLATGVATVAGALLAVLALLKVLDLGFFAVLDRPFTLVTDHALLGSGLDFVRESSGPWAARGAVLAAVLFAGATLVGVPLAMVRLTRGLARHRRGAARVVAALSALWVLAATTGVRAAPDQPVASVDAARLVVEKVQSSIDAVADQRRFERDVTQDAFQAPRDGELQALRGKDVVVVFVESYGRAALEGADMESVRTLLDSEGVELEAAGYDARSGFLTSPTFGGSSWLAHASLLSGLWVDDQQRYERVLSSPRRTVTAVFARSGWRTVAVMPSNREAWPEGQAFYDVDTVYDRTNLGYAGPSFGFSGMPDQFALGAFERLELASGPRAPVMAQIALTSSHGPWAPLPTYVDPADLGDGSVFESIRADATSAGDLWRDRDQVPDAYRASIRYSLTTVLDLVRDYRGEGLVVVLVGDHQPGTIISGFGGNRDVPVTVIADDPAVIERVEGWGWNPGLRPADDAPVWSMADFRDRFLRAFSGAEPPDPAADDPSADRR